MKAKQINEFTRNNNPLDTLGIGRTANIINLAINNKDLTKINIKKDKNSLDKLIRSLKNLHNSEIEELVEDYLDYLSDVLSPGPSMYLSPAKSKYLFWLFKFLGQNNIDILTYFFDDIEVIGVVPAEIIKQAEIADKNHPSVTYYTFLQNYIYNTKINPLIDKGWDLFNVMNDENILEYILIKYE